MWNILHGLVVVAAGWQLANAEWMTTSADNYKAQNYKIQKQDTGQ